MKNIFFIITLGLMMSPVMAQKNFDKHIGFAGKESIIVNIQIADSIAVHTWNKQEVYVKASVNINDNKDNEAYLTSFDEEGQNINIRAFFEDGFFRNGKNSCVETMILWELYIPENAAFAIETIDGNITIGGVTGEIKAKSISGFIDWKVLPNRNADLELKSISGTFYSDLDLDTHPKGDSFPPRINHKMNNGGDLVQLETISGDIFCRKSK